MPYGGVSKKPKIEGRLGQGGRYQGGKKTTKRQSATPPQVRYQESKPQYATPPQVRYQQSQPPPVNNRPFYSTGRWGGYGADNGSDLWQSFKNYWRPSIDYGLDVTSQYTYPNPAITPQYQGWWSNRDRGRIQYGNYNYGSQNPYGDVTVPATPPQVRYQDTHPASKKTNATTTTPDTGPRFMGTSFLFRQVPGQNEANDVLDYNSGSEDNGYGYGYGDYGYGGGGGGGWSNPFNEYQRGYAAQSTPAQARPTINTVQDYNAARGYATQNQAARYLQLLTNWKF